jgi:hypothetical protein
LNRWERGAERVYEQRMGISCSRKSRMRGRIKLKLAHLESGSILVPDQLYLQDFAGEWLWLQPFGFLAPLLSNFGAGNVEATCAVDVSLGVNVDVHIRSGECISHLPDNSFLFDCIIHGPDDLALHATGDARFGDEGPELFLFHHTTEDARKSICSTRSLRASSWNIQGTKRFIQRHHIYFTALSELSHDEDLIQIAMSSISKIFLRSDACPEMSTLEEMLQHKDEILVLEVYREDRRNRTATIGLWVNAADLAPQHIYRHDFGNAIYYEVTSPFIERVAAEPNSAMTIAGDHLTTNQPSLIRPRELIVGDARIIEGLRAPFDEETTRDRVLVESDYLQDENPLTFWFRMANSTRRPELILGVSLPETESS